MNIPPPSHMILQQQQQMNFNNQPSSPTNSTSGFGEGNNSTTGGGGIILAPPLRCVQLSGLALLKIVQDGGRTDQCAGCLLGIEDGVGLLQITDSFAFPESTLIPDQPDRGFDDDEHDRHKINNNVPEEDASIFQSEMIGLLHDVNSDDNCVGWYRSIHGGDWCTDQLIEQQFDRQEELDAETGPRCVLLVYDPFQSNNGYIHIISCRIRCGISFSYE
jgi:translation initiation factor 3 subunit H